MLCITDNHLVSTLKLTSLFVCFLSIRTEVVIFLSKSEMFLNHFVGRGTKQTADPPDLSFRTMTVKTSLLRLVEKWFSLKILEIKKCEYPLYSTHVGGHIKKKTADDESIAFIVSRIGFRTRRLRHRPPPPPLLPPPANKSCLPSVWMKWRV